MIDINFYVEYGYLKLENENIRIEHYKKLNEKICEEYNIHKNGKFDIKSIKDKNNVQLDIGTFDPFSKTMFLESSYLKGDLTKIQMFEIIEALLHEPKHLKQLLEYEKDNNSYPGFYTSLPNNLGYHSQKEEDEAYTQTFNEIQEIINNHQNTTGKEKQFYDGLQNYLNQRIEEHEKCKQNDIQNFENIDIKLNGLFSKSLKTKQNNLSKILPEIKKDLEIDSFLSASYNKLLPTCTEYLNVEFPENKCEIFKHENIWYCNLITKSTINQHKFTFGIKDNTLKISSVIGPYVKNAYNPKICQNIFNDILKIKNAYEKENNVKLNIEFSKY